MRAYVYVLFRPDGTPCYVGKGRGDRWTHHERRPKVRGHNPHLARIIAKAGGELPKVKVRVGLTDIEAFAIEVALIAAIGRGKNGPLVNLTDGGDGLVNPSPETRAKMSARAITRLQDPVARARFTRLGRRGSISDETRQKMSASHSGKKKSPAHVAAVAAALRGKPKSAEHCAIMSAQRLGVKRGDYSASHRAAISEGNRKYWQRVRDGAIIR